MSTMTRKPKKKIPLRGKKAEQMALDFTRGQGQNRVTFYKCGVLEIARRDQLPLRVVDKNGSIRLIPPDRMVHRPQLDDQYGDAHELSGQGKYISNDAINGQGTSRTVTGAHSVNPYLAEEGSYHTIIQCFHHLAKSRIARLTARFARDRINGQHLLWQGAAKVDGAIAVSDWITEEDLWELANKLNPGLKALLRKSKAAIRKGVKKHETPRTKFSNNLNVLRRARRTFRIATGETEYRGGETPYGVPLEQCGFAIDMFFLTTGIDAQVGQEEGEYHYRLAYGRNTPWALYYRDWQGMGTTNRIAFLNNKVRAEVIRLQA
jgi:hypothetical protein